MIIISTRLGSKGKVHRITHDALLKTSETWISPLYVSLRRETTICKITRKKKKSKFFSLLLFKIFSDYNSSVNQVNHGFVKYKDRNQLPLVTIGCSRSFLSSTLNLNDLPSVPMQFNRRSIRHSS